jgi:hypothetical protein
VVSGDQALHMVMHAGALPWPDSLPTLSIPLIFTPSVPFYMSPGKRVCEGNTVF